MNFKDKLFFIKNLSIMLKSGVSLTEALEIIANQFESKKNKEIIKKINSKIMNGQNLSSALSSEKNIFDDFFINIIKIGEQSGTLEENLKFLTEQIEKEYSLRQKIKGALTYPFIVFLLIIFSGTFISLFVLPHLIDFFSAFDIELPLTTKILLFIASFMKKFGYILLIFFIFIIFIFYLLLKKNFFKKIIEKITLHLPIIKNFFIYNNLAKITRNLGILLKSGISIVSSLEIVENTTESLIYKEAIKKCLTTVKQGEQLKTGMEKNSIFFPKTLISAIYTGEKSGKLDETLISISNFYEEEIDYLTKNFSTIIEPIILFFVGVLVAFIALSIIQPIYQLTGSIK